MPSSAPGAWREGENDDVFWGQGEGQITLPTRPFVEGHLLTTTTFLHRFDAIFYRSDRDHQRDFADGLEEMRTNNWTITKRWSREYEPLYRRIHASSCFSRDSVSIAQQSFPIESLKVGGSNFVGSKFYQTFTIHPKLQNICVFENKKVLLSHLNLDLNLLLSFLQTLLVLPHKLNRGIAVVAVDI